nr:T9SS type A sorting domain-containing protein [Fodinibius salicampi]
MYFFFSLFIVADILYAQDPDSTPLYYPYAEWEVEHADYSGNPFDVIATVTFTHTSSGEEIITEMFYDGDWDWETGTKGSVNIFKFRFSGTKLGEWIFNTSSNESALNRLSGSIEVVEQSNATQARGFINHQNAKWIWVGNEKAFIPTLVMRGGEGLDQYHNNLSQLDADITEFIGGHGFKGFHIPVWYSWWDITAEDGLYTNSSLDMTDSNVSPDPEAFKVMESIIKRIYEEGGFIHIWNHGPITGMDSGEIGRNSVRMQRLQRYVAARLGPLPGWTMGVGWDVWDRWTGAEVATWRNYYHSKLGWPHIIGGRIHKNDDPISSIMTNQTDYIGHEDHATINYNGNIAYDRWVDWLTEYPNKPHLSEDRFRIDTGEEESRNFDDDNRVRKTIWESAMVGGVGSIWGHGPWINDEYSHSSVFDNKGMFKVFSNFWTDRFAVDFERNNSLTDGYALSTPSKNKLIFYKESTSSIDMDLTGVTVESAVAVDTRAAPYTEINITSNIISNSQITWMAPNSSDWVIAIDGTDDGSGGQPPSNPPSIDEVSTTVSSAEVVYSEISNADSYEYRLDGGDPVNIGTTNPYGITNLSAGTAYDLQMRSVNSDGTSDWSATTTFNTNQENQPPKSPPAFDNINTTTTTAEVSYSTVSDADSYAYRLNSGDPVNIGTSNPFEITGLTSNTSYTLQMRAVNSEGTSDWSTDTTFTTQESANPPSSPPNIDKVNATETTATVSYSGTDNTDSYEYRLDGNEPVDIGTTNPFNIEGLRPGTSYDLQMRAVNSDGNSDWSSTTTFTTQQESQSPDSPPIIDEVTTTETTAKVYYIEVNNTGSYEYRLDEGDPIDIGTTNPFTISDLSPGTSYDLQMRAVNSNGTSSWSADTSITTTSPQEMIPGEVVLQQNYPNPFNPGTTIRFGIPRASHVRLELFDMIGKKILILVDTQKKAGFHNITFSATNLASGIYIYRLTSENTVQSKKLTIIQ